MLNPFRPSWGEPYVELVERMRRAVVDARTAARGHEAVIVSHQAPIWMIRLATEGRRSGTTPRKSRVRAGLAHLADLPRRRAALAQLQRAGRVPARPGPARGGRMTVRPTVCGVAVGCARRGAAARRARACSQDPNSVAAQAKAGDQKGYVSGDGASRASRRRSAATPVELTGNAARRSPWDIATDPRQGARHQRLGLVVRALRRRGSRASQKTWSDAAGRQGAGRVHGHRLP